MMNNNKEVAVPHIAPETYAEVRDQPRTSQISNKNEITDVYCRNGWVWFKSQQIKTDKISTERTCNTQDEITVNGSSEFRIPISPTVENIEKAYEVMREFYQNPPNGIKIPKLAKILDVAEIETLEKNAPNPIIPESGSQWDQRGKELCFYVTWEQNGEPSLSAKEYKIFMLEMIKRLDEKDVEGIGYMASVNADRVFTKDGKRGDIPVISTYIEYIEEYGQSQNGDPVKLTNTLFVYEKDFAAAGYANPLRDLVITAEDLQKAGITEIANDIAKRQAEFLQHDSPRRVKNLADKLLLALVSKPDQAALEETKEAIASRQAFIDIIQQSISSINKYSSTDAKLPEIRKEAQESLRRMNLNDLEKLSNAAKHVESEIKENFEINIIKPTLGILQSAYKNSKNVTEFVDTVYISLKAKNIGIEQHEQNIKEAAAKAFHDIKDHRKDSMNIFEKLLNNIMKLFGSKLNQDIKKNTALSFVDTINQKKQNKKGNSLGM